MNQINNRVEPLYERSPERLLAIWPYEIIKVSGIILSGVCEIQHGWCTPIRLMCQKKKRHKKKQNPIN